MSAYYSLQDLDVTFRPLGVWPGKLTEPFERKRSPFSASWRATIRDLGRELRNLDAERIVLQLAMRERDIRRDGLPNARAVAEHPGVVLSFGSRFGPLQYATDVYTGWEDNLRAIALAMEALRAVDRYGVSRSGEQYQGWKQLASGRNPADDAIPDAEAAEAFLAPYGGDWRAAARELHPDAGGDSAEFAKVMRARELLHG